MLCCQPASALYHLYTDSVTDTPDSGAEPVVPACNEDGGSCPEGFVCTDAADGAICLSVPLWLPYALSLTADNPVIIRVCFVATLAVVRGQQALTTYQPPIACTPQRSRLFARSDSRALTLQPKAHAVAPARCRALMSTETRSATAAPHPTAPASASTVALAAAPHASVRPALPVSYLITKVLCASPEYTLPTASLFQLGPYSHQAV